MKKAMDNFIKNPNRNAPRAQPNYEPEYVRKGIDVKPAPGTEFTSIDDDVFDENGDKVDINGHYIDNNEYINFDIAQIQTPKQRVVVEPKNPTPQASGTPAVGEYILMVSGKLIMSGLLVVIEERVKDIVYGDDKEFRDIVNPDDIVVLKRVNIKIGIFIDE